MIEASLIFGELNIKSSSLYQDYPAFSFAFMIASPYSFLRQKKNVVISAIDLSQILAAMPS